MTRRDIGAWVMSQRVAVDGGLGMSRRCPRRLHGDGRIRSSESKVWRLGTSEGGGIWGQVWSRGRWVLIEWLR